MGIRTELNRIKPIIYQIGQFDLHRSKFAVKILNLSNASPMQNFESVRKTSTTYQMAENLK